MSIEHATQSDAPLNHLTWAFEHWQGLGIVSFKCKWLFFSVFHNNYYSKLKMTFQAAHFECDYRFLNQITQLKNEFLFERSFAGCNQNKLTEMWP